MKTLPGIIDIAVPTYNCARWFDEFIESILAQDCQDWRIVTRDDGSRDETRQTVLRWQAKLGDKLHVIENPGNVNLGMVGNYDAVLQACTGHFVALSDPDDVWMPGKLSRIAQALREAELAWGEATPLIVCTDAEVVDEKTACIAPSFWRWARMKTKFVSIFSRMLVESPVLTSTIILNQPVLKRAMPLAGAAVCPDWWLALVTCAFGKIVVLDEKTICYRRHGHNDSLTPLSRERNILKRAAGAHAKARFLLTQISPQARAFCERFEPLLAEPDTRAARAATMLHSMPSPKAQFTIFKHRLLFSSTLKQVAMYLCL